MSVPKSVVKINKKNGVTYTSSCDKVQYTLNELIRAALRDTGRFICYETKKNIRSSGIEKITGRMLKSVQYWVRKSQKTPDLQIGIKPIGFYLGFYELGDSQHPQFGFLQHGAKDNIDKIVEIQSKYLSALEQENPIVSDEEYMGDDTN